jgi:hypothetical protein
MFTVEERLQRAIDHFEQYMSPEVREIFVEDPQMDAFYKYYKQKWERALNMLRKRKRS